MLIGLALLFGTLTVWQFDQLAIWQQHDTRGHLYVSTIKKPQIWKDLNP